MSGVNPKKRTSPPPSERNNTALTVLLFLPPLALPTTLLMVLVFLCVDVVPWPGCGSGSRRSRRRRRCFERANRSSSSLSTSSTFQLHVASHPEQTARTSCSLQWTTSKEPYRRRTHRGQKVTQRQTYPNRRRQRPPRLHGNTSLLRTLALTSRRW